MGSVEEWVYKIGVVIVKGERAVLRVNSGRPTVTNGDIVAYMCESDVLFPNYFGKELFSLIKSPIYQVYSAATLCFIDGFLRNLISESRQRRSRKPLWI